MSDAGLILGGLLGLIIFGLILLKVFSKKRGRVSADMVKKIKDQWGWIQGENDFERMIMEADKLLDFALRQRGFQGNFTEKMRQAEGLKILSDVNGLWAAHKLRNRVAHEMDHRMRIGNGEYKRALKVFKKGIWEVCG